MEDHDNTVDEGKPKGGFYTCCYGPAVKKKTVTQKDIARLCDELNISFGSDYTFVPQAICEGGIKMLKWPNSEKIPEAYKCFRFHKTYQFHDSMLITTNGEWPFIKDEKTQSDLWRDSENIIWSCPWNRHPTFNAHGVVLDLFLKAFYGAPCWTHKELDRVLSAFINAGFEIKRKTIGKNSTLREWGEGGLARTTKYDQ